MLRTTLRRCVGCRMYTASPGTSASETKNGPALSEEVEDAPPKTFAQILEEMGKRKKASEARFNFPLSILYEGRHGSVHYGSVSASDIRKPISIGDLLLLASGPVMVVSRKSRQDGKLIVANAVGITREIGISTVEARLGSLIRPSSIGNRSLYDPEGGRVSPEVHNLLAVELRNFYNRAAAKSSSIQDKVGDILRLLQSEDQPRTMAFFDFVALVDRIDLSTCDAIEYPSDYLKVATPRLTPESIYAVRMALEHYTLANKHVLEFSYLGAYCLTVLPRKIEARNVRILTAPTIASSSDTTFPRSQLEYCKDYALGNLSTSNPSSDGLALEIIRKHPDFAKKNLSQGSAAEMVNRYGMLNSNGPYLDKYAHHWMGSPPVKPGTSYDQDIFQKIRSEHDEPVYCIDSATAHEIDDGISISKIGDTAVVGVHIADPTSAFGPDLAASVFKKPTTVYLPTGPLFMMDESVSEAFSLKPGARRRALSVFTTYDLETGRRIGTQIKHSILSNVVTKTYTQVDDELADGHTGDLKTLSDLASKLEASRFANGAFSFRFGGTPSVSVESDGIHLAPQLNSSNSLATRLVTEMMIQANCSVAEFTAERKLPNVYRSQTLEFWTASEKLEFENAVAAHTPLGFKFRANIPRARLSTGISSHAALGVPLYSHFTSPLRRGQDILTHLSVAHHLAGHGTPFDHAKLGGMLPWIETAQLQAKQCQNVALRYWILKALMDRVGETVRGTICEVHPDFVMVYLPDYGVRARADFKGQIDQDVVGKITEVDAVGNWCNICI
ncbi:hypothetical protein B9G98_04405 [Wickerhamiella sorbophila]|uniref:RNB domain-containing protein n=1 Tax=Wickerhamiella sorbophila TaxID=45607 RepID=A0A2T0FP75_9ASCO|nr:hypothetical protein B9G98_04405 [Wickerhamiella sorbophila]PRT56785.1 hypothetical protein B9G98_04405 [Wickerhamiella sorbophila]